MKPRILWTAVFAAVFSFGCAPEELPSETLAPTPAVADFAGFPVSICNSLMRFYWQDDEQDLSRVCEVANAAEEACSRLCLDDQLQTFLAIIHRESYFRQDAQGKPGEDSRGVAQVRRIYEKKLRRAWRHLGIRLGPASEIRTQVFLGAMVYRDKLASAGGDVRKAVRSYNGSTRLKVTALYADRVFASRARIFRSPYEPGERSELWRACLEVGK